MKNNLAMDFVVNKENKTISVKREFNAELPLVWDAYTKSELLDQWWAPKPWKAKTKTMDFKEGGHWLYAMVGPNGEQHWSIASYKVIHFQKKFIGIDAFTDENGNINKELPQSSWEVTFTDQGNRTLVELNIGYADLNQLEQTIAMGFQEGLTTAMEGLDELLPALVSNKS